MLLVNVGYFVYIGPQSARVSSILTRSQSGFEDSESAHLNNMMNGFHRSYRLDSTAALLGVLTVAVGAGTKSSRVIGVGLAVTLCATTLFAGEVWSKHRALHYRDALATAGRTVQTRAT
jgi:hypothetical protein